MTVLLLPEVTSEPSVLRWTVGPGLIRIHVVGKMNGSHLIITGDGHDPKALVPFAVQKMLTDGLLSMISVAPGEIYTTLSHGQDWKQIGSQVRTILFQTLSEPSGWPDGDLLPSSCVQKNPVAQKLSLDNPGVDKAGVKNGRYARALKRILHHAWNRKNLSSREAHAEKASRIAAPADKKLSSTAPSPRTTSFKTAGLTTLAPMSYSSSPQSPTVSHSLSLTDRVTEYADRELKEGVNELLDGPMGTVLRSHGGIIEVADVHNGIIDLVLGGNCRGCSAASYTLGIRIERELRRTYPQLNLVREVPKPLST